MQKQSVMNLQNMVFKFEDAKDHEDSSRECRGLGIIGFRVYDLGFKVLTVGFA